jgi:hypothetical protein
MSRSCFTDSKSYFVSEASDYRLLKDHDLIDSPAYIVMKAADEFKDKTTAPMLRLLGAFSRHQFSADYTITMFEFDLR